MAKKRTKKRESNRAKEDPLDITLHPARSLLAPGVLDEVHRVLRTVLPEWSKRLRVRLDEWSRDWIEVHSTRSGTLERAVRKMIAPGETYEELVEELGPVHERDVGVVTITGAYSGLTMVVHVDDWVFTPHPDHQLWGNFICFDIERETVEGMPAAQWAASACAAFCGAIDVAHGFVETDGEYTAKNKIGWNVVGVAPERYLPGLYWMNVFGKPYVKLIGKRRLLTAPGAVTRQGGGHVLVRFGEDPWAWTSREYRTAIARGLDHIGRQYFFDKKARRRETIAPPYRFESDKIAGAGPIRRAGEIIVDYTTHRVYLKTPRRK